MKYTGYLKTMDKIKLFITPMLLFCLMCSGYKRKEYICLYAMFAHDMNMLLAPEIHVDDIPKIEEKMLETVMLMEGLIPPGEHRFIIHQLTELPSKLYDNGPIQGGWGCHSGETSLGKVVRCVRKGGVSFDKTLITVYTNKEIANFKNIMFGNETVPYYVNSEQYIKLYGTRTIMNINSFQKNKILYQLALFIHYVYKDKEDIFEENKSYTEFTSGLYRLYMGHVYIKQNSIERMGENFLNWIEYTYSNILQRLYTTTNGRQNLLYDLNSLYSDIHGNQYNGTLKFENISFKTNVQMRDAIIYRIKNGTIFGEDLSLIKERYETTIIETYNKAIILNKKHIGRGIQYVEEREARIVVNENHERIKLPRKFINDIYENWHEKKQIDSWFMMKDITKMPVEGEYLISHYHFYLFNTLHFQFIQMITYCITCSRRIQIRLWTK